jgi:hypothetical protein
MDGWVGWDASLVQAYTITTVTQVSKEFPHHL